MSNKGEKIDPKRIIILSYFTAKPLPPTRISLKHQLRDAKKAHKIELFQIISTPFLLKGKKLVIH